MNKILEVKNLETIFKTDEGTVHAVNGIDFDVNEGETLGIVGESGCGKSVSMLSMMQLIPTPPGKVINGEAIFQGNDLLKMSPDEIRHVRGSQISMVFQDPMTFFNPVLRIGKQITEPLQIHLNVSKEEAFERAVKLLELIGIPKAKERMQDYPYQFSGGMRQRAMIAMALICTPKLLIADEPTTALDVTIQAQIIDLVKELRDELGMAIIWITHDLGVIAGLAERVNVMYAGFIIEKSDIQGIYKKPMHPYTLGLLGSLPRLDLNKREALRAIEGIPPIMYKETSFCPFAPRCSFVVDKCLRQNPPLIPLDGDGNRSTACWVDLETGKVR